MIYTRQPDETAIAFAAFAAYRDMGDERSLEAVAQKLSKSKTLMGRWSTKNNWTERAAQYDDYLREQDRKAYEKERKKARTERFKIIRGLKTKLAQSLQTLDPEQISVSELIRLAQLVLNEERMEFDDLPIHRKEISGKDGGPITIDDTGLTDEDRANRIIALFDAARTRGN